MRVKTSIDGEVGDYFVTVTRQHPRSEEHVPLPEMLRLLQSPESQPPIVRPHDGRVDDLLDRIDALEALLERPPPEPPGVDLAPLIDRIDILERRAATPQSPPAPTLAPADADLPRMFRQAGPPAPATQSTGAPDVGDVIDAINEVERGARRSIDDIYSRLEALSRRIDDLGAQLLDLPSEPQPPVEAAEHGDAVETLTRWLTDISNRTDRAEAAVAEMKQAPPIAAATAEPVPMPPTPLLTLDEIKAAAVADIERAAKARRDLALGEGADARDALQRLVELAHNAKTGRPSSLGELQRLSEHRALPWQDLADGYIGEHDTGSRILVSTMIIAESGRDQILAPDMTDTNQIDNIRAATIAALNAAGESL